MHGTQQRLDPRDAFAKRGCLRHLLKDFLVQARILCSHLACQLHAPAARTKALPDKIIQDEAAGSRIMLMTQVLADAYRCEASIEDADALMAAAIAGAAAVGATVVGESTVRYVPHGLTIAVFLAESHIVLTTWPEHRLLLIDTLLCNADMDADIAVDEIVRRLCPAGEVVRQRIPRRIADGPSV
jgi:S-adenosylmethionine decarboxylase